ncbi:MAG: FAD-dependent oxidoreductase, partial [Promethearchaeota archaeon]
KVTVNLNEQATAKKLTQRNFDCVLLASGTVAGAPPIDGVEMSHVTSAYDVISLGLDNLGRVAVVGGDSLGCYAALYLASRSDSVDLYDADEALGVNIGRSTRWVILKALRENGVQQHPDTRVTGIYKRSISVMSNGDFHEVPATTVVLATRPQPRDRLLKQLELSGIRTELIGSVTKRMNLLEIIHSSYELANKLEL